MPPLMFYGVKNRSSRENNFSALLATGCLVTLLEVTGPVSFAAL